VKKVNFKLLVLLLIGIIISETADAQRWGGHKKAGFWDDWSVNASGGLTSFFGDLSIYDADLVSKFTLESGPAFSGLITKHLKEKKIGVSGQLLYGGFKGENTSGTSFEASFYELNAQLRLNLINLIWPYNISKFSLEAYGGIGQFVFTSTQTQVIDNETETRVQDTGVPEFVYFAGAGIGYNFYTNFSFTADMALRQAQNDMLDVKTYGDNFDYYTYISVGLTYNIDSFKKSRFSTRGRNTRYKASGRLPMRRRR